VRRFLRLLDALPRWLRWAFFLPVGLILSLLVNVVVEILLDLAGLPNVHVTLAGSVRTGVIRFVAGLTVTLFPAVLAPRPWPVGVVMFMIGAAMGASPVAYGIYMHAAASRVLLVCGALVVYVLGGWLGLYLIRHMGRVNDVTASESERRRNQR
jgi:hypothetical protein